jgi:hypothetical protein
MNLERTGTKASMSGFNMLFWRLIGETKEMQEKPRVEYEVGVQDDSTLLSWFQ